MSGVRVGVSQVSLLWILRRSSEIRGAIKLKFWKVFLTLSRVKFIL